MTAFLPTSAGELRERGWDYLDVIIFTGDAYVDHPSFGAAVIGRALEAQGFRVAIVPQPNWRDDLRDFKKLGAPRLFFGVTSGSMDSMVNRYTANKRLRSRDAYTPDGRNDMRPDYAACVYAQALKALFPQTPVVLGGIEASLRRLTHYDYWQNALRPSILYDARADLLVYGMGEKPVAEIAHRLSNGQAVATLTDIPQTAFLRRWDASLQRTDALTLHSFEECQKSKAKFADNFVRIEEESNKVHAATLQERVKDMVVTVNPPCPPMTEQEIDASFDLPYARLPHPRYRGKRIPAYEMVKHSINIHRGCFGGCSFCTISMHQGKLVASRSPQSVLEEVKKVAALPDFRGYLSDVGGPSANMYRMQGKNPAACSKCARYSCLHPKRCANLNIDPAPLLDLYAQIRALPGIKKAFVSSGVRYDLFLSVHGFLDEAAKRYFQTLLRHHVSGRLKVAPEHTACATLAAMRKPSYRLFDALKRLFDAQNRAENLRLQLIPYFISSHPACTNANMQQLANLTRQQGFRLEQVQDFTPTPMTLSSTMYYTGINPYTKEKIYVARTREEKLKQNSYFFWYKRN